MSLPRKHSQSHVLICKTVLRKSLRGLLMMLLLFFRATIFKIPSPKPMKFHRRRLRSSPEDNDQYVDDREMMTSSCEWASAGPLAIQ